MMLSGTNETDLELLESYLDDELSTLETEALRQRLAADPALTAALAELTAQRELRRQLFATYEPSDRSVQRVLEHVEHKIENQMVWAERLSGLKFLSGVAATLLIGFLGGYVFRSGPGATMNAPAAPQGEQPVAVVNNPVPGGPREIQMVGRTLPFAGPTPGLNVPGSNTSLAGYDVALTDDAGHVIGMQRFPTLQAAQEFTNDLGQIQRQRQQLQNAGVRLIADQF